MSFCTSCGSSVSANAKFCSSCGKPAITAQTSNAQSSSSVNTVSASGGYGSSVSGDVASAISQTIFVVPVSFLNSLDKIFQEKGISSFAAVGAIGTAEDIRQKVLGKISASPQKSMRYVCLIGDWNDVPPFEFYPEQQIDRDKFFSTDSFYGCTGDYEESPIEAAIPDLLVGRIPSLSANVVSEALFAKLGVDEDAKTAFSFAVSCEKWTIPTQTIVNEFLGTPHFERSKQSPESGSIDDCSVLLCPQWLEPDLRGAVDKKITKPNSVILFNVHGGPDEPGWVGQSKHDKYDQPKIFGPNTVNDFNSAVVVTEACYGGALSYSSISIAESFFENKGRSFVGSSTIAYGTPSDENIFAADIMALNYLLHLSRGFSSGDSLNYAKERVLSSDPLCSPVTVKTILSFNLFGAPWYSRRKSSSNARVARASTTDGRSIVDEIRNRSNSLNIDKDDVLVNIRNRYRSSLSDKGKQFFYKADQAREKLKRFIDYEKVNDLLEDWCEDPDVFTLQFLSNGNEEGYVLYSEGKSRGISTEMMILNLDANGSLKQTLTSKGML